MSFSITLDYNHSVEHTSVYLPYTVLPDVLILLYHIAIKAALEVDCHILILNRLHTTRSAAPINSMSTIRKSNISPYIPAKTILVNG